MGWLLALLEVLKFLEFLTSPIGVTASFWLSLYWLLVQGFEMNGLLAALLPGFVAIDLYFSLRQLGD